MLARGEKVKNSLIFLCLDEAVLTLELTRVSDSGPVAISFRF